MMDFFPLCSDRWPYSHKSLTTRARELLRQLQLGELHALRGIEGGIENTNYFVTCDEGEFVLTLFERLTAEQLPFYLHLMKHLAHKGIPVPDPRANKAGDILHTVCGKPAAVVNRLAGRSQLAPEAVHCAAVGGMLARMHLAGRDYDRHQPNLRGLPWWNETGARGAAAHRPGPGCAAARRAGLPEPHCRQPGLCRPARGPVHADLFRDNVMFEGAQLTGFFDFYFAGVDSFLFDLAVCLNDWCIDLPTGARCAPRHRHDRRLPGRAGADGGRAQPVARAAAGRSTALLDLAAVGLTCRAKLRCSHRTILALRTRAAPAGAARRHSLRTCTPYHRRQNETAHRPRTHWPGLGQGRHLRLPPPAPGHGGLFFMTMAAMSLASVVPLVGPAIALTLLPSATLAMMVASAEALQGAFPRPRCCWWPSARGAIACTT